MLHHTAYGERGANGGASQPERSDRTRAVLGASAVLVWLLASALGILLIALGSFIPGVLAPMLGETVALLIALAFQIAGIVIEIGAIVGLALFWQDQRAAPARDAAVVEIAGDLDALLAELMPIITRGDPGADGIYDDFAPSVVRLRAKLESPRLADRLMLMSGSFSAKMAIDVAQYLSLRDDLRDGLAAVNTMQFLGFTDGSRLRADGWRTSAITDDFLAHFSDGPALLGWFSTLRTMCDVVLGEPPLGWRTKPEFDRVRPQVAELRNRLTKRRKAVFDEIEDAA